MRSDIFYVDSFASTPFTGNPTPVCYTNTGLQPETMQSIAAELNLPVTAFITKRNQQAGEYDIHYFTAIAEIPACGHATLASARIAMMYDKTDKVIFHTAEGLAIAAIAKEDVIMMSYPRYEWRSTTVDKETLASLGISTYRSAAFSPELETLFIELESADQVRKIQPDFPRLTKSSNTIMEVVITAASDDPKYDYLLRSFCPWIGIDEDPVTGSVHSVLGAFWQQRFNKTDLRAWQASARGGELRINAFEDRTEIGGATTIILKGEINY